MAINIVILGAGFGGLETATGLSERLDPAHRITLIDKSDHFIIGFSKFEVMFGRHTADEVKAYYADLAPRRVRFVRDTITEIAVDERCVRTNGGTFPYDYLIVALGADVIPDATPGFSEGGYHFYTLDGAAALYPKLDHFQGGTILLSILGAPYKCPPAPYEAAFQLHDFFRDRGLRDKVTLQMAIPAPKPLPVAPGAAEEIRRRFAERDIKLLTDTKVVALDPEKQEAHVDGRDPLPYDLFIGVPLHRPPAVVSRSLLGSSGWIRVDPDTLATEFDGVYAIGDVTTIPVGEKAVPKAGAFAESAARVVVEQIVHQLTGTGAPSRFEAIGTCYLEFGDGEVAEIRANYRGAEKPEVALAQPTVALREGKRRFVDERLSRWFGRESDLTTEP